LKCKDYLSKDGKMQGPKTYLTFFFYKEVNNCGTERVLTLDRYIIVVLIWNLWWNII